MPVETKQVPSLQHLAQQYAAEMVALQPTGPFLLIGVGLGSSLAATAVAHALTLLTHKTLLVSLMMLLHGIYSFVLRLPGMGLCCILDQVQIMLDTASNVKTVQRVYHTGIAPSYLDVADEAHTKAHISLSALHH